jgi:broad specificity phosphatase PhoE
LNGEMRRINLVRHGESTWNSVRRVQGSHADVHLSERGKAQSALLGERLRGMDLSAVYCSSAERAVETARIAFGGERRIELRDDLREISFGNWEGMLVSEVRERFPGVLERWFQAPSEAEIAGAERYVDFYRRAVGAVDGIIESSERDILVVSHGGIICAWLTHVLGMDPDDIWSFSLPNASLTTVILDFKPRLRLLGDVSHLDGSSLGFDGMPAPVRE